MEVRINSTIPITYSTAHCRCSAATIFRSLTAPTLRGWHHEAGTFLCPACAKAQQLPGIVPAGQDEPKPARTPGRCDHETITQRRNRIQQMINTGDPLPSRRALGRLFGVSDTTIHYDLQVIKKGATK